MSRLLVVSTRSLLLAGALAVAAAPLLAPVFSAPAEAAGGGGGGGAGAGGNGGGHGGGHGAGGVAGVDGGPGAGGGRGGSGPAGAHGRGGGIGAAEGHGRGASNDRGAVASALGALNAAHASPTARANAAPNSRVGQIASYERAMVQALAIQDPVARQAAIAQARASELQAAANRPLSRDVVARVDSLLGLPPTPYR